VLAFLLSVVVLGTCVVAVAVETMSGIGDQPATGSGELPSAWEPWRSIVLGARDRVVRAARTVGRGTASAARLTSAAAARHLQATGRRATLAAGTAKRAVLRASGAAGRAARRAGGASSRGTDRVGGVASVQTGTAAAPARDTVRRPERATQPSSTAERLAVSAARDGDTAVMTMEPLPSAPPRTEVPPRAAPFDPGPDGAMPTMARSAARAIADAPDPTPGRGPGSARVPDGPAAWPQPHRPEPPDQGSALTEPPPRPQGNGSRPAANGPAPARSLPPRGRPPGQVVPLRPPATTRLKAGGELLVLVTVLGVIASCVLVAVAVVANEALSNL
jgi:hypothetical protein